MPRRKNIKPTLIYWLLDVRPETIAAGWSNGQPFYCGKTVKSLRSRLWTHFQTARKHPDRPVSVRIFDCGEKVRAVLVATVPAENDWAACERRWIEILRGSFPNTVNTSDGGDGAPGNIPTAETRAKISAAHRGRVHSAETRAKISAAHKGRVLSAEHKEKVGAAFRGKRLTAEHRAKLSVAKRGKPVPKLVGHIVSPETREKLRIASTGRTKSAATRAKISRSKIAARTLARSAQHA